MSAPRVSVVVPTCRRAPLLAEALASVRAQTFPDWECIVADDDGTEETAAAIAATSDHRMRHVVVAGRGGTPARVRNAGLAEARGELVAFLDDDDRWRPEKLALQVSALDDDEGAVLCCTRVEEFGGRRAIWPHGPYPPRFRYDVLIPGNPVGTTTVLARRAAVVDAGGFDERWKLAEDYALWLDLVARGHVRFLDRVLAEYRVHDGNVSARELEVLSWVERILEERRLRGVLDDAAVRRRMRSIHWKRAELSAGMLDKARWGWKALTS